MTSEQTQVPREIPKIKPAKIVGLISDTHIPTRAKCIPEKVFKIFENADFIIHAGDLVELAVVDELEQLAPVLAVHGNMDGPEVSGALPKLNSLKVSDWKIGVMHDPNTMQHKHPIPQHLAHAPDLSITSFGQDDAEPCGTEPVNPAGLGRTV